jgi:adenosylhomocysteine nucleosidase
MHSAGSQPALHRGLLVTVPRIITTAAEKRQLGEETGALAVDMESAGVACRAAEARVPMAALRVITDSADEPLPLDFNRCLDSNGQFHYGRLILLLARRPLAGGGLVRLGRHSALAGQSLASFLAGSLPRIARAAAPPVDPA